MGPRPSPILVETLREVIRDLEGVFDPNDPALVSLRKIVLRRIADIEIAHAEKELVPT